LKRNINSKYNKLKKKQNRFIWQLLVRGSKMKPINMLPIVVTYWLVLSLLNTIVLVINANQIKITTNSYISSLPNNHRIDKSLQLFQNSLQRLDLKLTCNFESSLSYNDNSSSRVHSQLKQVEWLKYDASSLNLLKIFSGIDSDLKRIVLSGNHSSGLRFKFKNLKDFSEAQAIYVCKLKNLMMDNDHKHLVNTEYVQEIHTNEMIKFQSALSLIHFELSYTVIQLTSNRAIIEIKSLEANYFSDNKNFYLIYSLVDSLKQEPILRGTIEAPLKSTYPNYLILEGLEAKTNYSLHIYLKTG